VSSPTTTPAAAAPSALQAVALGARAAARAGWLIAPGFVVALLRWALLWPPVLFLAGMLRGGAEAALARPGAGAADAAAGAFLALTAPRTGFILVGLSLAGALASGALRVAWLAGALPTLGEQLARRPASPRFAEGLAYGFAPLLGTALLAFALELTSILFGLGAVLAAALLALHRGHALAAHAAVPAVLGAAVLSGAVALWAVAGLAGDAALARTALTGERPAVALLEGLRRVALRPGAFLLAGFMVLLAAAALLGSTQLLDALELTVAGGAPPVVAIGPRLVTAALTACLGALLDLWRLATVAALACAEP
jgi:hypothetical protein